MIYSDFDRIIINKKLDKILFWYFLNLNIFFR